MSPATDRPKILPTPETRPDAEVEAAGGSEDAVRLRALRRPIGVIVASNLAIMAVGLIFLVQFWRVGATALFWPLLATIVTVGLNLVFLLRGGRIKVAGYVSVSVLFLFLVSGIAQSGGFYDASFAWLFVVPLAAAFLVDLTALIVFTVLVLAATIGFWFLPPEALPNLIPDDMRATHSLLNRLGALVSLGLMTAFFVRSQRAAQKLLWKSNRALEEEADAHGRTAKALEESEAQYRDLVENSADLIWTHDLGGRVLSVNDAFVRLLGYSEEEIVGAGFERLLSPESGSRWESYLDVIQAAGSYRGPMNLVTKSGEVETLEFHNTLRDDGGPAIVRAVARDVTRQVEAQRNLERRVDQEQLMVAISARFIDTSPDQLGLAIAVALAEIGVFLECDRLGFFELREDGRFERLSRWPDREEPSEEAPVAIPEIRRRLERFETVTLANVAELEEASRVEVTDLLGQDVRSAALVPVFGRKGLLGLLTLEMTGSERQWPRAQQALAHLAGSVFGNAIMRMRGEEEAARLQSEVQQARKMESLGLIAGGIAHDFNNLLMVVLGNTSLAMSQAQEGSGTHEALQAIDSSARQAARLTAQMLAYAGGGTLHRAAIRLDEIVSAELGRTRAGASDQVEVRTDFAPELPEVFADPALVRQMLRALLDNSIEAIGDGVGVVQLSTREVTLLEESEPRGYRPIRRTASPGSYVALEVRDSGSGIEAGALQKIFDPFFSTKFAGRGLGLAAVLGVVRGHEGVIEVDSDGSGTTMRVLLPVFSGEASRRPAAPASVSSVLTELGDSADPPVLIVDSDAAIVAVVDGLLASQGLDSVRAPSAERAVELMRGDERPVRAVIADLETVEGDDELRVTRSRMPEIPWIMMSETSADDAAERLASVGASAYLSKPFEGGRLLSLLDGLLREYESDDPATARRR